MQVVQFDLNILLPRKQGVFSSRSRSWISPSLLAPASPHTVSSSSRNNYHVHSSSSLDCYPNATATFRQLNIWNLMLQYILLLVQHGQCSTWLIVAAFQPPLKKHITLNLPANSFPMLLEPPWVHPAILPFSLPSPPPPVIPLSPLHRPIHQSRGKLYSSCCVGYSYSWQEYRQCFTYLF